MSPVGPQDMLTDTTNHHHTPNRAEAFGTLWPALLTAEDLILLSTEQFAQGIQDRMPGESQPSPAVGVHMTWEPGFSEATGADLLPLSPIHLPERCWLEPWRQGRRRLYAQGPAQHLRPLHLLLLAWSWLVRMKVGAARCLHPCCPPEALQPSLPRGPQGPWRGGKAECQSGCLDL